MPLKAGERIRETSTTEGVGTYTLDGASAGFQSFSVIGAGHLCKYFATDGAGWEAGIGTVLLAPTRLERTHVLASSNAGAAVNWGAGTRTLRVGPLGALSLPRTLSKAVGGGVGTTVLTQDEQRRESIEFTGALTGARTIEVDATPWTAIYFNNTTGAFALTVKVAGQTGVVVPQGRRAVLYCDGVDVRLAAPAPSGTNGSEFPSGTALVFNQTNAPPGWTKQTTHNDKALRLTSGTVGSGGATAFTSVFGAGKVTGSSALSAAQLASHAHIVGLSESNSGAGQNAFSTIGSSTRSSTISSDSNGSGSTHNHTLSLDLHYVDVILATKD